MIFFSFFFEFISMLCLLRRWCSSYTVSIVGRSNVGKSTLFNRLQATHANVMDNKVVKAIVSEKSGTTREGKIANCKLGRLSVDLRDTGGVEDDELTLVSDLVSKMRQKVFEKIFNSHLLLVVIDAQTGVTPVDIRVSQLVREWMSDLERPPKVVLVANKAEGETMFGQYVADCYEMDLGDPVLVSAKHNEGMDDLYERIVVELEDDLVEQKEEEREEDIGGLEPDEDDAGSHDYRSEHDPEESTSESENLLFKTIQIGIIGRPNAGKSSLLNALVNDDRAIVDESPGTTTDAIAVNWNFHNHSLRFVDTAGIGRGWKQGKDSNELGMETLRTVFGSHVCVLVLDASHAFRSNAVKFPSRSEVKLGNEVLDNGKCLLIAVNKWDEIPEGNQGRFRRGILACLESAFYSLKNVPIVFISAKEKSNLNTLLVNTVSTYRKWNTKINASRLNDWLEAFVARNPPPWKDGQKQYPKFITQTRIRPPTFCLYTNTFATFPENYLRQMKELMREEFGLRGIPIRVNLRSTLMPKPGVRLRDQDVARWKRLGPKQAVAAKEMRKFKKVSDTELD
jgi:GTP-binding protein